MSRKQTGRTRHREQERWTAERRPRARPEPAETDRRAAAAMTAASRTAVDHNGRAARWREFPETTGTAADNGRESEPKANRQGKAPRAGTLDGRTETASQACLARLSAQNREAPKELGERERKYLVLREKMQQAYFQCQRPILQKTFF